MLANPPHAGPEGEPGSGLMRGGLRCVDVALQKILTAICIALMGVMLMTVGGQVVMRYAFNSPLSWSEELARFAMIWMAFAAAALAFRKGLHIKLEGISLFPRRFAPAVHTAAHVVVLAILLALLYFGWQITARTVTQHSPALGLPMAAMYFSIPFSAACMIFFALFGWKSKPQSQASNPSAGAPT
jgi:TRAP-type transport system small permease protein